MPIYAYRCSTCGHAKDVLQKMSDPLLTTCPACGAAAFQKQVTAAGFQLKGSGWYVTDFRNGDNKAPAKPAEGAASDSAAPSETPKTDTPSAVPSGGAKGDGAAPTKAPAPAPAPVAGPVAAPPAAGTK